MLAAVSGRARGVALVGVLLVLGLAVRARVLASPYGQLNSDEALTGLIAKHVLHGDIPIVVPGNAYIAPLEGYLYVPVALTAGYHLLALKILTTVMWAIAAWCVYLAARRMGLPNAWLAGALVWVVPGMLLVVSTLAYAGYPSGMACVALAIWALARIADEPGGPRWQDSALFGFFCGAAVYLHPIYLTAVVPLAAVATLRYWSKLRHWWVPVALSGLAGLAPLIVWNLRHDWGSLHRAAANFPESTYTERFVRQFADGLPRAFGLRLESDAWTFGAPLSIMLTAGVLLAAAAGFVLQVRQQGPRRIVGAATLAALLGIGPLLALLQDTYYTRDARYMIVFVPLLALGITALLSELTRRWQLLAGCAALAIAVGVLTVPFMLQTFGTKLADPNAGFDDLVGQVESARIEKVYGSYWLVHSMEVASDGRLDTAAIGFVRFPDSDRTVRSAPPQDVAVVLTPDDEARLPLGRILPLPRDRYTRVVRPAGIVYLPERSVRSGSADPSRARGTMGR